MEEHQEAPEVSTEPNPTIDEAVREHIRLIAALKDCPRFGWAKWIEHKITDRLILLKQVITDYFIEGYKNGKYRDK